jgi:hypothetical protein
MSDPSQLNDSKNVPLDDGPEYLVINDLGDRVTFQRFRSRPKSPVSDTRGYQSEKSVKEIALEWGFPENVYSRALISKGSATREVGDLLLVSGKRALVLQVKSRNAEKDDLQKIERWVKREFGKAASQGKGSIRSMEESDQVFENGRGTKLSLQGSQLEIGVLVVLDIPAVPEQLIVKVNSDSKMLVITLTEFEFLFGQLKSVSAVIRYVFRVAFMEPIELGSEMQRFMSLAMADNDVALAKPAVDLSDGAYRLSTPILPLEPVGVLDEEAHLFFRKVCEIIGAYATESGADPKVLATIFGGIDDLPVQSGEMLGRFILDGLDFFQSQDSELGQFAWKFRFVFQEERGMRFVFGVSKKFDPHRTNEMFERRLRITHHQFQRDSANLEGKLTIGVLVTPRDTWPNIDVGLMVVDDRQQLSEEDFEGYVSSWNQFRPPGAGPMP